MPKTCSTRRDVPASPAAPNQRAWIEYRPYGVVAVIGPWNFPLATPGAICIHALAAGNAVILKPEDALARGASATIGGPETATGDRYVQPTILVGVPADALAATDETFGPTLAIVNVADTDEAIALTNASPYGLGSAVFSQHRGEAIARRLRVGMTSINDALMVSQNVALPFGGRGDSGYGRKHGAEGLREFAYPHAITEKTGPAPFPTSTFDRPAGSMAAALAAARDRILAEEDPRL